MISDKDLVSGCISHYPSAQKELYLRYAPRMKGVCLRYIADKEEAKDVLQEAFVKVFLNIKSYSCKGSLEGWIRRIIVNTAISYLRKRKSSLIVSSNEQFFDDLEDSEVGEYDSQNYSLTETELIHILNLVPEDFKIVFNLFYFEQLSHKEISDTLGIKEETSRSRLLRARKILQKEVSELVRIKESNPDIVKAYK